MTVKELRKKYPTFVYKGYTYELKKKDLHISFEFALPPDIEFYPEASIKNILEKDIKRVGESALDNFVFHLGLAEMPSYWKATSSPKIVVEAGSLNTAQINWWHDLFLKGMGEYFYKNTIDFTKKKFLEFKTIHNSHDREKYVRKLSNRIFVPIGGGKDAVVTYEILKGTPFALNPKAEQKALLRHMKESAIVVERAIDPKLLALNRKGYLNGHTPFSAYLAFLTVFCAALFDYKYIALSNERSSSEGNAEYLGHTINHQYSKSFDFEKKFRAYSKNYLAPSVEYFSFLRPLYELQIAKLFSQYPKYFATFLSCNEAHKTHSGTRRASDRWCGACAKCLFVFTALYPFVQTERLEKIFGKSLFADVSLIPLMEELVGERNFKPFECVGTSKESLAAFYLSLRKTHPPLPPLLKHFRQHIAKKHPSLPRDAKSILTSWNSQHFLPLHLEKTLKSMLQ